MLSLSALVFRLLLSLLLVLAPVVLPPCGLLGLRRWCVEL